MHPSPPRLAHSQAKEQGGRHEPAHLRQAKPDQSGQGPPTDSPHQPKEPRDRPAVQCSRQQTLVQSTRGDHDRKRQGRQEAEGRTCFPGQRSHRTRSQPDTSTAAAPHSGPAGTCVQPGPGARIQLRDSGGTAHRIRCASRLDRLCCHQWLLGWLRRRIGW